MVGIWCSELDPFRLLSLRKVQKPPSLAKGRSMLNGILRKLGISLRIVKWNERGDLLNSIGVLGWIPSYFCPRKGSKSHIPLPRE
ncbi:hypothetical protein DHD05_04550 [Arenibacter sp. N53]|nr:hypothetical protein [Arenibacter sp. N53]